MDSSLWLMKEFKGMNNLREKELFEKRLQEKRRD